MKKNERLIYTNDNGDGIEVSWFSPYFPADNGFSQELANTLTTAKNNLKDGQTYISSSLESRYISIDGLFELSNYNTLEQRLRRVFNPKIGGRLVFADADSERYIDVRLEGLPKINRAKGYATFAIDLMAPDPFWRGQDLSEIIAVLTPTFSWPVVIMQQVGMTFGVRGFATEAVITNSGDVSCGFRAVFKAQGQVTGPYLINKDTGDKIKLSTTMASGDVIEITNEPFRKIITVNGTKNFAVLDRLATTFFELAIGDNLIGYGADVNAAHLEAAIYFAPLYL